MSQDIAARMQASRGILRTATVIALANIYAFWVGAHAFDGPMGLFFWFLFVVEVIATVALVFTEIIGGIINKVVIAQEAREVAKAGKF